MMKTAVVFYGSMREVELGSKSWHILGEDVDYFVVTWDIINPHYTDDSGPCRFEPIKFPVPIAASIIINYESHIKHLCDSGVELYGGSALLYILYHWSLIRTLPGISSYDKIIVTRPDMFLATVDDTEWQPVVFPGKVTFAGNVDFGINDWMLTTDPAGLDTLYDIYNNAMQTRDFIDENGEWKFIHHYLVEKVNADPDKFFYERGSYWPTFPTMIIIRPNHTVAWEELPYGPVLSYLIMRHTFEFEIEVSGVAYDRTPEELAIQKLLTSTNFNLRA